ncbi:deoxyribose-phosphate aldolase [Mesomycoplasma neurolyticum]|uniref:Deoxyribose-phosphate aldolase n=1 Tax=Mesomycoplasma neurolyticum TaxID=2120 RepID=A0A449A554_9BACT|nr:deoxyribose-phosphate aldolase [Mesomycoplasma neurolyticum]VEU59366.1 deoxyribose-phosphate aldolase [Mesomycoplasma neurolyticum]
MNWAKLIDHTYLKPEATSKDINKLIDEAKQYQFKTICVNSSWVKFAKEKLENTDIGITAVVGFPLGAMITQAKVQEAKLAINHGANEIDMVINIGRLKEKKYDYVLNEIKAIKKEIGNSILKVIIETALLTKEEIKKATEIVVNAKADFVKTSTGFSYRGATFEDIELMASVTKGQIAIKAAGGIKTLDDLAKMYELGATRFGTSSSVKILENKTVKSSEY